MSQFPPFPDEVNPYAAPEADLSPGAEGIEPSGEAEAIRLRHQRHETNVRSIGLLYYLGAVGLAIASASVIFLITQMPRLAQPGDPDPLGPRFSVPFFVGVAAGFLAITLLYLATGYGLRRLRGWARWLAVFQASLAIVVVGFGLLARLATAGPEGEMLGQLITLLISGYIIGLLIAPQSKVIFSPEYQEIIAQTPEIRTGMSPVVKFLLFVVGALVLLALLGGVVGGLMRR